MKWYRTASATTAATTPEQVHHIPLHRQVIPWAMRSNVTAVHLADNWLERRWVTVGARP